MRIQTTDNNCGVFSVYNALSIVGARPSIKRISKLTNTTQNGTSEFGIMQALLDYGYSPKQFYIKNNKRLKQILDGETKFQWEDGSIGYFHFPIIACVNNYRHWLVIGGKTENRYLILDSDNTKVNKQRNGIYTMSFNALCEKWKYNGSFYGITIHGNV